MGFMKLSIITTAYNEEKNIIPLYKKIKRAMCDIDYEIITVDDGSTDNTFNELRKIDDKKSKIILLKEHMGQSFALYRGIEKSRGDIIATIDSDLQSDPIDIIEMVKELGKGYDCICGWRHDRKDRFVKKITSKIGNFLNNKILGINLHDNNCTVKVFRKDCISGVRYFDNFHRFIPIMIKKQGFRIKEFKVRHYPRVYGISKYGTHDRIFGNLKTLLTIKLNYKWLLKC